MQQLHFLCLQDCQKHIRDDMVSSDIGSHPSPLFAGNIKTTYGKMAQDYAIWFWLCDLFSL